MPFYPSLRQFNDKTQRTRIIQNILNLKSALNEQVPDKRLEDNLLVATWNIREFGKNAKAKRLTECGFYIAEIISAYDLVALQEVAEDLEDLNTLIRILGPDWDYIMTDVTDGASGNGERLAFLFDKRKVRFRKLAGEIVLPAVGGKPVLQFARTPFVVSFQSGWFKFFIITTHVYYGNASKSSEEYKRRVDEIGKLGQVLKGRAKDDKANYILLGDFNVTGDDESDLTYKALTKEGGFKIPDQLKGFKTNALRTMPYDRIAYIDQPGFMEFVQSKKSAGVFDYFKIVFKDEDEKYYKDSGCEFTSFKEWRTYQMSDHLPMWIEFKVDFSEAYLEKLKTEEYK